MEKNPIPLILWSAFGVTHLVLVLISTLIPAASAEPARLLFVIPALTAASASVAATRFFPPAMPAQTTHIVRWALAESASLMGFVAWYTSGDHLVQAVCTGAGLLAWALALPKGSEGWPRASG